MSYLLDTKALEMHALSAFNKATSIMKEHGIGMTLYTNFCENRSLNSEGEFCFADKDGYHFRFLERGSLYCDNVTQSLSEIIYWAIECEISHAASIYASKNRVPMQDSRRIMFAKMLQLYEAIGIEYAQRARSEIEIILKKAPFKDDLF